MGTGKVPARSRRAFQLEFPPMLRITFSASFDVHNARERDGATPRKGSPQHLWYQQTERAV